MTTQNESCSCCKARWIKFQLCERLTCQDERQTAQVLEYWDGENPAPDVECEECSGSGSGGVGSGGSGGGEGSEFYVYNLPLPDSDEHAFEGEPCAVGYAVLDEQTDLDPSSGSGSSGECEENWTYRIVVLVGQASTRLQGELVADLCPEAEQGSGSGSGSGSGGAGIQVAGLTALDPPPRNGVPELENTLIDNRFKRAGEEGDLVELSMDHSECGAKLKYYISEVVRKPFSPVVDLPSDNEEDCVYLENTPIYTEHCGENSIRQLLTEPCEQGTGGGPDCEQCEEVPRNDGPETCE